MRTRRVASRQRRTVLKHVRRLAPRPTPSTHLSW